MAAEVLSLAIHHRLAHSEVLEVVEGVVAIFTAIESAEMLAAVPECDLARDQHRAALKLLAVAERELRSLCHSLRDAGGAEPM